MADIEITGSAHAAEVFLACIPLSGQYGRDTHNMRLAAAEYLARHLPDSMPQVEAVLGTAWDGVLLTKILWAGKESECTGSRVFEAAAEKMSRELAAGVSRNPTYGAGDYSNLPTWMTFIGRAGLPVGNELIGVLEAYAAKHSAVLPPNWIHPAVKTVGLLVAAGGDSELICRASEVVGNLRKVTDRKGLTTSFHATLNDASQQLSEARSTCQGTSADVRSRRRRAKVAPANRVARVAVGAAAGLRTA